MKFKSDIEVQAGLKDSSGAIGSLGQVLSSTASGVSWTAPFDGITGSGTADQLARFTSSKSIGNSIVYDNGNFVIVGTGGNTGNIKFQVNGNARVRNELWLESTINKGAYVYTLPNKSGTFAMTNDLVGFVPYTGATGDVNLGIHQLKADSLAVSTSSVESVDAGEIVWNAIDGTFDMGLISGVTLQAGQEMHIYGKATEVISNGQAVMFAGVQGDHILIAKADAATINANPEYFIGVATNDFAVNQFGYVTIFGNVRGLDTTGYTLGTVLYYDSTTNTDGLLTDTMPVAPNAKIEVAAVVRVHATQGILLVRPHAMPKVKDIQDVYAPSPSNNNGLWWSTANSRYENNSIAGILGYTPADDANVVHLTGDELITGIKSFDYSYSGIENFTTRLNYFFDNGFIRSDVIPIETINNLTSQSIFRVDSTGSVRANSFVKIGGNSTQYLKADGSVSTAMNSRIEVNFVATAGQTTFTTPYEVGQIDVYYNGSKLYPNEFTATNGTTVVLAQAATLNAQISIVKYVAALSTSAIRNETTFTTTAGQTTFAVNYSPGQVDVFYNGSKLNISEFTATDGVSVVLGFACAAGESIVIDSYVNQVSGASGTANKVAKFTGVASLGDSQIDDNGTNVSIGNTTNPNTYKFDVNGTSIIRGVATFGNSVNIIDNNVLNLGSNQGGGAILKYNSNGNLDITPRAGYNTSFTAGNVGIGTSGLELKMNIVGEGGAFPATGGTSQTGALRLEQEGSNICADFGSNGASGVWLQVTNKTNLAQIFPLLLNPNGGNVLIGTTTDNGAKLQVNGTVSASGRLSLGDGVVSNFNAISIGSGVYTNTAAISIGASNPTGGVVSPIITFTAPNASYSYAVRGGMYYNGSNLQMEFRTTSDYRVKEDLIEDFNAIDLLDKIKIYDHKWIGASGRSYSVIAHELQNVIPYLVSGQKDAILEDGSMDLQSVDYSKLVPILIKGIQELKAEIEILKNK